MGRPRRVSEPHSGGGWTTRVADPPPPEVRVGRACVPVDHENLDRFGWSERTDEGRRRVVRSALRFAAEIGVQVVVPPGRDPSRPAGGGRRGQPAAAGGVPVERRLGGGPDEARGPSLSRRRPGGALGPSSHCSSTDSLGGRRPITREPWRKGWATCATNCRRPPPGRGGRGSLPARREAITPRSARLSLSTSPWPATCGVRRSRPMRAPAC